MYKLNSSGLYPLLQSAYRQCFAGELPRSASLCGLRLQALRDSTSPRARWPLFRWWHSALLFIQSE